MVQVVCAGEVLLFSPGQAKPLVSCASPELHVFLSAYALPLRWDRPEWVFFFPQIEARMARTVCSPATQRV